MIGNSNLIKMTTFKVAAVINIHAPIAMVWAVMLDLKNYRYWNPFIFDVKAVPDSLAIGSRFQLQVRWANHTTANSWETVTRLAAPSTINGESFTAELTYRYASWPARVGLVRATREQTLFQQKGQPTVYQTQESFTGILARFISLPAVQDGFQRHAHALKRHAEWMATNGSSSLLVE
jgi:hypothetical protein